MTWSVEILRFAESCGKCGRSMKQAINRQLSGELSGE